MKPRRLHDEQRLSEVSKAITRYIAASYQIPVEWIEEYNDLVQQGKGSLL